MPGVASYAIEEALKKASTDLQRKKILGIVTRQDAENLAAELDDGIDPVWTRRGGSTIAVQVPHEVVKQIRALDEEREALRMPPRSLGRLDVLWDVDFNSNAVDREKNISFARSCPTEKVNARVSQFPVASHVLWVKGAGNTKKKQNKQVQKLCKNQMCVRCETPATQRCGKGPWSTHGYTLICKRCTGEKYKFPEYQMQKSKDTATSSSAASSAALHDVIMSDRTGQRMTRSKSKRIRSPSKTTGSPRYVVLHVLFHRLFSSLFLIIDIYYFSATTSVKNLPLTKRKVWIATKIRRRKKMHLKVTTMGNGCWMMVHW